MLKISEMAKLANTTRRTLIFYDEEGLFCPAEKNSAGYRYYQYDQLYELLFILGLRNLGVPVEKIKQLQSNNDDSVNEQLFDLQESIDDKIDSLTKIQTIISKKLSVITESNQLKLYKPQIVNRPKKIFWCSQASASCTDEEIAQLFSDFYHQLDSLAFMDTTMSGFLTDLPESDPNAWEDASFRVIKESNPTTSDVIVPKIVKPAGKYVSVKVIGDTPGIQKGLSQIQQFCLKNNYQINNNLWQINDGDNLAEHGGTEEQWLEYSVN